MSLLLTFARASRSTLQSGSPKGFSHLLARSVSSNSSDLLIMQAANRLQKALRAGGPSFGGWQMLPGSTVSRLLARAGYDWICVDTEHGNIDDGAMHEAVAAIAACGVSPIVRITDNQGWMVKRALDAGAHGIVVPLLNTVADAERLVSTAKFPPSGIRGFGSPFVMEQFGNITSKEYLAQANESLLTIVQIETKQALENVDAIAQVNGVDVLLVGPFDLGNSIGENILEKGVTDILKAAVARILQAAHNAGKKAAIYSVSGEQARQYADMGFDMISVYGDFSAILEANTKALATAKGGIMHSALNLAKGAVQGASNLASGSKGETSS